MGRQHRYLRTQRRQRGGVDRRQSSGDAPGGSADEIHRPDPDVEQFEEQRGRYGSFAAWMIVLLLVATAAAIVGTIVFWPD
jgi:hypothetical protein